MADEKVVRATLRFGLDKNGAVTVKAAEQEVADGLKKVEKNAEDAEKKLSKLKESAEKMRMVGTAIAGVGAAILTPIGMAVNAYVSKIGEAGVVSRQWIQANKEIEDSQMRIGRVAAQELLPYLKDAAKFAGQVADFVEKNPDAIKAALTIGGAAVAGGGAIAGLATAVSTGAALIQVLSAAGIIGTGAAAAGGAATGLTAVGTAAAGIVAPLAAAAAAIVALGVSTFNVAEGVVKDVSWLSDTLISSSKDFADYQSKIAELKKKPEWMLIAPAFYEAPDENTFNALQNAYKKDPSLTQGLVTPSIFGGYTSPAGSSGTSLYDAAGTTFRSADQAAALAKQLAALNDLYAESDDLLQKRVDAGRKGAADLLKLDTDYNTDKLQQEKDFQDSEARILEDFTSARLKTLRDYSTAEDRTQEDYYAARTQAAEKYDEQTVKAEADHQKDIRRLMEDSGDRIKNLAGQRDAYAIMQEMQDTEKERKRKEEDYKTDTERTNKAYADDLTEQERQFQKEKARREADFQLRLSDEKAQNDLAASRRKTAYDTANTAELTAYTQQRKNLQTQTQLVLTDITRVFNALQTRINILAGPTAVVPGTDPGLTPTKPKGGGLTPLASGGYAEFGKYWLAEAGREFVLNAETTRAAERLAGGSLSQERVLRLGGGVNLAQSFTFNGTPSGSDAQALVATIRRETALVMTQVFQGMGA